MVSFLHGNEKQENKHDLVQVETREKYKLKTKNKLLVNGTESN